MELAAAHPDLAATQKLAAAQALYLAKQAPGARTSHIRWSGGETQVLEYGEGEPVVLIHGGMGNAFDFAPIIPAIAERFHVYALDRPGNGLSSRFDYRKVAYVEHIETFLSEVLDALKLERVPIVAHSMGGMWAVYFALARPQQVARLVMLGAPAGSRRWIPFPIRGFRVPLLGRVLSKVFLQNGTPEGTRKFFSQVLVAHAERLSNEFLDASICSARRNYQGWLGMLERAVDLRGVRPQLLLESRWRQLGVPTVFIWGERDAFDTPENGAAIAAQVPAGASLVRIPDAGHMVWMDQPERVASETLRALGA